MKAQWTVDASEQRGMGGERVFNVVSEGRYGGLIANVSAWWVDVESARQNAHLISAAPDLLEALKSWQKFMHENYSTTDISWWNETEKAIAKAEGKD